MVALGWRSSKTGMSTPGLQRLSVQWCLEKESRSMRESGSIPCSGMMPVFYLVCCFLMSRTKYIYQRWSGMLDCMAHVFIQVPGLGFSLRLCPQRLFSSATSVGSEPIPSLRRPWGRLEGSTQIVGNIWDRAFSPSPFSNLPSKCWCKGKPGPKAL